MGIFTFDQAVKKAGATPETVKVTSVSNPDNEPEKHEGFFSSIASDFQSRGQKVNDTSKSVLEEKTNPLQGGFNIAGQVAGGVGDLISQTIKAIPGSETVGKALTGMSQKIADVVTKNPNIVNGLNAINAGMDAYSAWAKDNPEDAKTIDGTFNLASLIPFGAGEKSVVNTVAKNGDTIVDLTKTVVDKAKSASGQVIDTTKDIAQGTKTIAESVIDTTSRIPSRISINVAEKQAVKQSIEELPTKVAKQAARDGIEVPDVKYLYEIPKEQKGVLKDLWKSAKDFSEGKSKTNPIEVVGKPIVERIKTLESEAGKVGQELGDVAKNLGTVTKDEVFTPLVENLKKVRGLNGITVNKKGIIDFTESGLQTAETAGDRKAIQSIFSQAIQDGSGISKHRLRQELFEILGGKKKSLTALTDTQDKAFQAIRQGLSDVLDAKSSGYKKLNQEYAKISSPLSEIRKLMKGVAGADEDILDMSAGLLARRLTSMAQSNPQIRQLLRTLDEATAVKGSTTVNIENLQDFYNILDKYYNITGKTGFQGQITAGVEKASGFKDAVTKVAGDLMGQTDAVKRKALEKALEEALK